MSEIGFEDMRPVPVSRDDVDTKTWLDRVAQAEREIKIFLDVDGVPVSIHDCDWTLVKPCGCVASIMSACAAGEVYATENDAWHELYDVEPHPHKRVRETHIRKMKSEGWTVRVETRTKAVRLFRLKCDHSQVTD